MRNGLVIAKMRSKPLKLEESIITELYEEISIKLYGKDLKKIRQVNLDLTSNDIKRRENNNR